MSSAVLARSTARVSGITPAKRLAALKGTHTGWLFAWDGATGELVAVHRGGKYGELRAPSALLLEPRLNAIADPAETRGYHRRGRPFARPR